MVTRNEVNSRIVEQLLRLSRQIETYPSLSATHVGWAEIVSEHIPALAELADAIGPDAYRVTFDDDTMKLMGPDGCIDRREFDLSTAADAMTTIANWGASHGIGVVATRRELAAILVEM